MKRIINKTTMALILALSMVLALLGGIFFAKQTNFANAADPLVNVKVEADTKSFTKGSTFNVTITVSPKVTVSGANFNSITLNIGANYDSATDTFGSENEYLSFVPVSSRVPVTKSTNISNTANFPDSSSYDASKIKGIAFISISSNQAVPVAANQEITFKFGIKVSEDVPDGTSFKIGILESFDNMYTYRVGTGNPVYIRANNADNFAVDTLNFAIKEPSKENNLDSLKAGQSDDEDDLQGIDISDPDDLKITVTDLVEPLSILPVPKDLGASVSVKPTNNSSAAETSLENGEIGKVAIPDDGELTIIVTAENGDTKEYKLTVTVVGGKLTALNAASDTETTGVTKNGLKETFDSTKLEYTVYVPSDSTKVTLSATISTGHSELDTLTLAKEGNFTVPASASSGTAFDVAGVEDGDKLTITVKADNNTGIKSEKDYTVTFDIVDVDAAIDTISVVGSISNKEFNNSTVRATEAKVDYYYLVVGENNASSTVTVAAKSSVAAVAIDSAVGTSKTLTEGQHTATITAEAGNSIIYSFYLEHYIPVLLKNNVVADFIFESKEDDFFFLRTYKQKKMVHGVDDYDIERYVIGQIADYTSVNVFLENFETSVRTNIKLYNAEGELVYNLGSSANSYTTDDLADSGKPVGTGWKLEYVVNGNVEDTVYLSVLGDLNGDGKIGAPDITVFAGVLQNNETHAATVGCIIVDRKAVRNSNKEGMEYRLALYIDNVGALPTASDIATLSMHIKEISFLYELFYTAD